MLELAKDNLHFVIGAVLVLLAIQFIVRFFIPACVVGSRLNKTVRSLKSIRAEHDGVWITDLDRLQQDCMTDEALKHCWSEFAETLHPQKQIDEFGTERVVRWRATARAEAFFSEQALIETPLRTEYFKHLPGILTGIGIIGTFSGLIFGLMDFQISEDANLVRASLASLVQKVGHAFVVSCSAIVLAMLATWIEKLTVTRRYKQVEDLCQLVDGFFDAGAGEEYLARLVAAAEESATQSAQMKDSLVTDLKQLLSEVADRQIAAAASNNQQLSSAVVGAINESLKEPMAQLSAGMSSVARDQGTAINNLLTDVLAGFTTKMDEMFGAQMRGMNDALLQTSAAIQAAAGKFDQLAVNLETAGQGAAEAMHERLETMMSSMELRQQAMNDRMATFVEELKSSMESSQTASAERVQSLLADLGAQVASAVSLIQDGARNSSVEQAAKLQDLGSRMSEFLGSMEDTLSQGQAQAAAGLESMLARLGDQTGQLIAGMDARHEASARAQQEVSASFAMETQTLVARLGQQVEALTARVQDASTSMKSAIAELSRASSEGIASMNRGAELLSGSATRFGGALESLSNCSDGVIEASKGLSDSAGKLQAIVALSNQALAGHQTAQQGFQTMIAELRQTVENASRDAKLTSDLVAQLESAADAVADVEEEAEAYLKSVSKVLGDAHAAFASSIKTTLKDSNSHFHVELGKAVDMLRGAILDLGDALEAVPSRG
jgi:hypothetical protein